MSGNIKEPEEEKLAPLVQSLVNVGFSEKDAKRILVICSDYADRRFEKFRRGRIKTEKARAEELYNMCNEFKNTRNFSGLIEGIKKKLLEVCTQNE